MGRAVAGVAVLSLTLFFSHPLSAAEENAASPSPGVVDSIQDWLASANRAFQGTIVRRLSTPSPGESDDAIAQKLKDVKEQERAAKEADDGKARAEADVQRKAAEDAKAKADADAQAQQAADAKAKEDADAKAMLEDAKRNADDAIKAAQKLAEERQAAEQKRAADEKTAAEAKRVAEQKKRDDEEAARLAEDTRAREEARRAEEQRQAAETAAEAEKNRQRTITLTHEPIAPAKDDAKRRARSNDIKVANADDVSSTSKRYERHLSRGPAVKRWIWRTRGRCRFVGRLHRGRYTVRAGDTLWLISKRYYHAGSRYRRILQANRWLHRNPNLIRPCQRLTLPRWRPHR